MGRRRLFQSENTPVEMPDVGEELPKHPFEAQKESLLDEGGDWRGLGLEKAPRITLDV